MMAAIRLNYDRGGTARCAAAGGRGGQITSVREEKEEEEEDEVARPMTYKCPKPKKAGGRRAMRRECNGIARMNAAPVRSSDQCKQWMTSLSNTVQEHINPRRDSLGDPIMMTGV